MATTLIVRHKIADYANWKKVYDGLGPVRKEKFDILGASVHRDSSDPNTIVVTHSFNNAQAAMAFANSAELKEAMGNAGVVSQPEIWFADDIEQTAY